MQSMAGLGAAGLAVGAVVAFAGAVVGGAGLAVGFGAGVAAGAQAATTKPIANNAISKTQNFPFRNMVSPPVIQLEKQTTLKDQLQVILLASPPFGDFRLFPLNFDLYSTCVW